MTSLSFYSPLFLYALPFALIPLAIHLLSRRRTVTLPFSNVALLRSLQQDRMRRVRLRQILLLILRTLLILLLVLAFARPAVQGTGAGVNVRTAAAILLDTSMSTRHRSSGTTLFDRSREQAVRVLSAFTARDDLALYLVDSETRRVDAPSIEALKQRLEGLEPGYDQTDMTSAVERAVEWMDGSDAPNRELYLLTDGARHAWEGRSDRPVDEPAQLDRLTVFTAFQRPDRSDNVSVDGIASSGTLLGPGEPATLQVDLRSHAAAGRSVRSLTVDVGDARAAQQQVSLEPGESRRLFIPFTPRQGGPLPVTVDIGADDLAVDSRRSAILHVPDSLRVLLIASADAAYYPRRALLAAAGPEGRLRVGVASPQEVSDTDLDRYDSYWLCNAPRLPDGLRAALKSRVEGGAGLAIFLGDAVDVRHYNAELLKDLLPARLVAVSGAPHAPGSDSDAFRSLRLPFPDHPVFAGLSAAGVNASSENVRSPRFYTHYRIHLDDGARPLLAFTDGFPAIAETTVGQGRVLLVASSFDLGWSELAVSGLVVPLLERMARYLSRDASGPLQLPLGRPLFREVPHARPREALLQPPSGESGLREPVTIWPEQRGRRSVWRIEDLDVPGVWEIRDGGSVVDRFAVGLAPGESDLSPVAPELVSARFPTARIVDLPPGPSTAETIRRTRYGRELWKPFLVAALVAALLEMALARTVRTARSGEPDLSPSASWKRS